MTNKDKFIAKEKTEQEEREKNRIKYIKNLGEAINEALLNPKFIEKVTPLLEEYGSVQFSDVGCLCQGGACSDQQGFTKYCKEAINFWEKEGVIVKFSISSGLTVKPDVYFNISTCYQKVNLFGYDDYTQEAPTSKR